MIFPSRPRTLDTKKKKKASLLTYFKCAKFKLTSMQLSKNSTHLGDLVRIDPFRLVSPMIWLEAIVIHWLDIFRLDVSSYPLYPQLASPDCQTIPLSYLSLYNSCHHQLPTLLVIKLSLIWSKLICGIFTLVQIESSSKLITNSISGHLLSKFKKKKHFAVLLKN